MWLVLDFDYCFILLVARLLFLILRKFCLDEVNNRKIKLNVVNKQAPLQNTIQSTQKTKQSNIKYNNYFLKEKY